MLGDARTGDNGLPHERTVLSWNRSALAVAANGGLLLRDGLLRGAAVIWIGGCAVIAIGAFVMLMSSGRDSFRLNSESRWTVDRVDRLTGVAAFVGALSLVDLVLVSI